MQDAYEMITKANNATQVVTKGTNGERLHEDEESELVVLLAVVVVVDGEVLDGFEAGAEEEEEDGDFDGDGVGAEPESTLTASFMPLAQWPIVPQMK